jgi:hypothetical protein
MLCSAGKRTDLAERRINVHSMKLSATKRCAFAFTLAALLLLRGPTPARSAPGSRQWVGSWAASQQIPESQNSLTAEDLRDIAIRQIFHLSIGGSSLRVHVSNTSAEVFGS